MPYNKAPMANIFFYHSRLLFERILGFQDRDVHSITYGCFDRYYWHYRLHDIPNVKFQEACLYLARWVDFLADLRLFLERYVEAAINFWSKSRHRDGSVDEIYPWERSFCATVMSTQAVTGAMLLLGKDFGINLIPTAEWLGKKNYPEVTNQMAAACLSLYNIYLITGKKQFSEAAEKKLDQIINRQLENGCYLEYDGADIGYATLTLSLIGEYAQKSKSNKAWKSMERCEKYLVERIDEKGSYNYSKTSRQTQFIYPSGLLRLKSSIVDRLKNGLLHNMVVNPLWMDDRYCIPLAIDYLLAYSIERRNMSC